MTKLTTIVRVIGRDEYSVTQTICGFVDPLEAQSAVNFLNLHTWSNEDFDDRMANLSKFDDRVEESLREAEAHFSDLTYTLSSLVVHGKL
jgi:hypothetical protein